KYFITFDLPEKASTIFYFFNLCTEFTIHKKHLLVLVVLGEILYQKELIMNGDHPLPVAKRYIPLIRQDMPQLF
ncbi:MAG: hypothetical protein HRT35_37145, partial [Algicola sp.]|nr:hypothetical protein [Algicola sp.]